MYTATPESELKRVNAMDNLETAIQALRVGMDAKALYNVEGALLMVRSLVEERQRDARRSA